LQFVYYLLFIMNLMVIVSTVSTANKDGTNPPYGFLAVALASLVFAIYYTRKRRLFPAILASACIVLTPLGFIQLVLSILALLLFVLRSTREYYRTTHKLGPVDESPVEVESDVESTEDGETRPLPAKAVPTSALARSNREYDVMIREATPEDADTIHALMHMAFEEYRNAVPPSSALDETEEQVATALREGGESAAILYEDDIAVAMVRFQYVDQAIYFFRLSVSPARRRRGYAKRLVKWIERQGVTKGLSISRCRVRQSVQNNLVLYQDLGYEIVDQQLVVRPTGTVKALTMEKKIAI
jgi:ribosomal protein S18 acetylase RimI-like enzyme